MLICDIRNWGIETIPSGLSMSGRAQWIAEAMDRFCRLLLREGLGSLQITAGSQAAYSLRRKHLTHALHVHTDKLALKLEGEAYHGGRCECRRIGVVKGPVYHLDFRSLYGSICASISLPALLASVAVAPLRALPNLPEGASGRIASVTVETEEPAYPVRREGLIIYPTGSFTTTLAGPELADAERHGRIRAWHAASVYALTPCLQSYARHLLALLDAARKADDSAMMEALKRLLVALPGKFGQRGFSWRADDSLCAPGPWGEWHQVERNRTVTRCRALGWQTQREEREDWAPNAIPSIAAWICSSGRVKLLEAIRAAGWKHVAYHDTDSLIVTARGYDRLRQAQMVGTGEPGRLRLLGRHEHCEIMGIKHYRLDESLKCSGQPRGTVEPGPDDTHYWYRAWLKSAVRAGRRPEVERALREWTRAGGYRHGRIMSDGRVEPWELG